MSLPVKTIGTRGDPLWLDYESRMRWHPQHPCNNNVLLPVRSFSASGFRRQKTNMTSWKIHHEWRCISYWKWWFSNVMLRETAQFQRFRKFLPANQWRLLAKFAGLYTPQTTKMTSWNIQHFESMYFLLKKQGWFFQSHTIHVIIYLHLGGSNLELFLGHELPPSLAHFLIHGIPNMKTHKKNQTNEGKYTNPTYGLGI